MGIQAFVIALVLVGALCYTLCDASCGQTTFTQRHGHFYYEIWNSTGEVCDWTFTPPSNRTDVMFLVTVPHIVRYTDDYWRDSVVLPDGSILPHDNTSREYKHTTDAWCGLYVTPPTSPEAVTCQAGRYVTDACPNPTRQSTTWPPRIKSDSHYYYALFSYAFIDCPSIERSEVTTSITEEQTKLTTSTTMRSTEYETTAAKRLPQGRSSLEASLETDLRRIKIIAVVMGVFSLILLLATVAVVMYYRRPRSPSFDSPVTFRNQNFRDETSLHNLDHYHNIDADRKI